MTRCYRYAVVCLIAGCVPPYGTYPSRSWSQRSQAGWQQAPAPTAAPDEYPAAPSEYPAAPSEYPASDEYDANIDNVENVDNVDGDARSSGNSGGWLCTAEASLGTTLGTWPTNYRTISGMQNGPTRDDASLKAMNDCRSLVTTALNLANLEGEETEGGDCKISRCSQM